MIIRPVARGDRLPPQLWLTVGLMVAIELGLSAADRGLLGEPGWRAWAVVRFAFWDMLFSGMAAPVYTAQPWAMFLTHAFLHSGFLHLAMNGVVLLALGKFVAERCGGWAMLLLFAVSAAAGGAAFGLIADTRAPMVGASGAVFGFIGLWQYWEAMARRQLGLTLRPVFATLGALVAINVVLAVALGGGLAWEAHLGGFLAGVALGPLMSAFARRRDRIDRRR
jgi:membrane associated rhomboid family serine protease